MPAPTSLYAVIPAGGVGTRLWPLSRTHHPKFLQPLTGTGRSLLQATHDRLTPAFGADRIYVVTGAGHAAGVARQLPELPEAHMLIEPSPRDSCAAIALAAAIIERRDPGAVMASFAADHLITDEEVFRAAVRDAVAGVLEHDVLMTLGIVPTRPETGYGYIHCGAPWPDSAARRVLSYREKPPLAEATEFQRSGDHLWNAGMFVWRASTFLDRLNRYRPDVGEPLARIAAAWDEPDGPDVFAELWPTVPKVAVEYAVMEPAAADGVVGTVPGSFGWSDIGDFETLAGLLGGADAGASVVHLPADSVPAGRALIDPDSERLIVVPSGGRLVATLGVRDLLVVDTADAVLICHRDWVQQIKAVATRLATDGPAGYS